MGQPSSVAVHDFGAALRKSHVFATAGWWENVYRSFFRNFASMTTLNADGIAQRAGIDRVIQLTTGRNVYVDEKVRDQPYEDILLEIFSDKDKRHAGWIQKELWADYIAYAIPPLCVCYMLPVIQLQAAWVRNQDDWIQRAKAGVKPFRMVEARNTSWTTLSIVVPYDALFSALDEHLHVRWVDNEPGWNG